MQILNPIEKAKYIEENFRKYIASTYDLESDIYREQFKNELYNSKLLKGPYISKSLEFKTTKTINELIEEGLLHKDFRLLGDMHLDRKLRSHQEKAIRLINKGHNLIVTTGTGSGKTESFLYPIINEILQEKTINEPGIRAIFLFPMNALVNDQFDRVRKILNKYPTIKYGYFTGNTKNKDGDIDGTKEYIKETTGSSVGQNELLDREQIRTNPPHILFTNYSMLEYILLRPKDDTLLSENAVDKWKFIVLDEAHIYKGALGIEIGMLLRRLQQRIGHDVQFILTSATLGVNNEEGIKKIQEFGYKLTSKKYNKEDILFSDRIDLDPINAKYKVDPVEYEYLYKNYNQEVLNKLLDKYKVESVENQTEGKLYDLILHDKNLYILNSCLSQSMSVIELFEKMKQYNFATLESLSAFIDIICKCKKAGLKIMDLKYHSFIRSVAGAFITLGEDPQISLSQREYINGRKAFEIGSCSKCNSMYIIGVEKNGKLHQNHSVDIYENYDEDENIVLDYFILENEINNLDVDYTSLTKYLLCPICGKLIDERTADKSLLACEHNNVEKVVIYKINKEDSKVKNNLTNCPICNGKSKKGLIRTVSMGKESATALITQIFFESLDKNYEESEINVNQNKLLGSTKEIKNLPKYTKQILSFSDSRQQASFAVKFAENNHHRLLRKRLLFEILKNKDVISFEEAEARLDSIIFKQDLFDTNSGENSLSSTKQAKITLLREILNVDGIYGGEGLGLFYFDFNPIVKLVNELSDSDVSGFLSTLNIFEKMNVKEFESYLQFIINSLRVIPAVRYEGLTIEDRENYFAYRMFDNHVKLIKPDKIYDASNKDISRSVHGLISKSNKSNKLETYTEKLFKVNKETADKLIEKIWDIFVDNNILYEYDTRNKLYSIDADRFNLHKYTDTKWYYCKKCRKLTRYNTKNICPHCFEENTLQITNPDEFLKNNYYRYQYINKKIEKLVYKEHTAQLSTEKGKERQNEFKNKKINYLSCSTTFEMGIDIGSLENVLLRNVPPSPANYIQRAGRAGRAQDSSAFVLTYCSPTSHDYTFFEKPLRMVDGICNTPVFTMENHKILYRHLLAMALSEFFKLNITAFSSVKAFYIDGGYEDFIKYIKSKPETLICNTNCVLASSEARELMNGVWIDSVLNGNEINVKFSKDRITSLIDEFEQNKQDAIKRNDDNAISYFAKQINLITKDRDLIGKLADGNLIPKYGFPTDLVEMFIKDISIKTDNYDLTRDMQIALSEYAPDSEIMVDKKTITSRYINKPQSLLQTYYYECPNCHKTILKFSEDKTFECQECQNREILKEVGKFITPKFGFTGEIKRNTATELKPKRSYSSPVKYVGNGILDGDVIEVNKFLQFYNTKNDELLIVNENSFFTCEDCGYTIIDNEHSLLTTIDKKHDGIYSKCNNTKLTKKGLGFAYKTDVLKMVISLPFDGGYNQAISTLYALLEGIAFAFDIERNDIDGIYVNENNKHVFVLFDTVPGGAGHVKRLLNKEEMIKAFEFAYEKVSQECCDIACYNCIKNYKNQKYHDRLRRPLAKDFLSKIIDTFKK